MHHFMTVPDLYSRREIDEDFLQIYEKLYPAAKIRVLSKNQYLKAYFSRPNDTEYQQMDFSLDTISLQCIYLRQIEEGVTQCLQGHDLVKKSIVYKEGKKRKGIYLNVCPVCKHIFSDLKEDVEKIEYLKIPYEIIDKEKN